MLTGVLFSPVLQLCEDSDEPDDATLCVPFHHEAITTSFLTLMALTLISMHVQLALA